MNKQKIPNEILEMPKRTDDIKARIDMIARTLYNGNNSAMARDLDTSDVNIGSYRKKGGVVPKIDFFADLNEKLNISLEWVVFGRGEMIESERSARVDLPAAYRDFFLDDFDQLESAVSRMRRRFERFTDPGQERDKDGAE